MKLVQAVKMVGLVLGATLVLTGCNGTLRMLPMLF